jgi:type 1 glutamine amidotransferase
MGGSRVKRAASLAILVGSWALLSGAGSHRALAGVPDLDIEKITAAVPRKATARPKRPRKLLIFTRCRRFRHGSIPWGSKALEIMGRQTGAYEVEVSDDVTVFRPGSLRRFDAVCMNNTTGVLTDDPELRKSLLDFVKSGKGIVGIHGATDCFEGTPCLAGGHRPRWRGQTGGNTVPDDTVNKGWPEYGEMMGGYFWGHPWAARERITIKVDEPDHPLCAAFGGKGFEIKEEMYQFRDPYSREKLRVLLTIDLDKTQKRMGMKRKDNDYAVSWVRSYGGGRVFYCSLGHNNHVFWNPAILRHYLDGIQFALGDLEADTTPSAAAVAPVDPPIEVF